MTTNRKIGIVIVLACALAAAAGVISGYFSREVAVGMAVVGIVIGTAVSRRRFSTGTDVTKRN